MILEDIKKKRDLFICAPTGGSTTGIYATLAKEFNSNSNIFDKINILKLDEWGGIPINDPNSCHSYLLKHILEPLKLDNSRYIGFNTAANDLEAECHQVQKDIDSKSLIDICILGLGKNGYLGLNEPASFLYRDCHIARLTESTMGHSMAQAMHGKPTFVMTTCIGSIMQSKK